jgi:hypothetical protein
MCRREDNTKMNLWEVRCDAVAELKMDSIKLWNFLTRYMAISF